ncbi:MAG: hypothetical protein K8I03_08590 [Ignavibacteria bacterium]|nr:hypothetical protein [Ignavibacteria bacterium]
MNYIKTFRKIKDHKLIIDIPEDFKSENVEVIVLSMNADIESNGSFMKVSEESFKEWDNDSDEIYNNM